MRWKEGGINYASGSFSIPGNNPRVCAYDNGTEVCDKGHKIASIGNCYSQSIGTISSTSPIFQPTFTICSTDYIGRVNSSSSIINRNTGSSGIFSLSTFDQVLSYYYNVLSSYGAISSEHVVAKPLSLEFDSSGVVVWSDSVVSSYYNYLNSLGIVGSFSIFTHNSGAILRAINAISDLYQYDIFGSVSVLMPFYFFPKISSTVGLAIVDDVYGGYSVVESSFKLACSNAYSGDEDNNPESICVGDLTPPSLEYVLPASGSVLRPLSTNISFDVVDAIGGVDQSSLYITVSGSQTAQVGGTALVSAGVVQVPLYATLDGTQERYSFVYNPPADWQHNETVYVSIYGTDLMPLDSEGEEFICGGLLTNDFNYNWSFRVEAISDLSASITGLSDSETPYLSGVFPAPFYSYACYDDDITFYVNDDHTGVDIDTLYVYINGVPIISGGVIGSSNVFLAGEKNSYQITWNNTVGFIYGDRIEVRVIASDLYAVSPNTLDTTYYFDVVDDSTLQIINFLPEVGITWDLKNTNIEVDVLDNVYNIDSSNLYISINEDVVDTTKTDIYGNRNLTTTYSGLSYISGTWVQDAEVMGAVINNTTVSGSCIYGGNILYGSSISGLMGSFPPPFDLTNSGIIINADIFSGVVVSGTLGTVLVSGVNWDGNYSGSTITDIDLTSFYANLVSSSGTVISGTVGYHLEYHPINDFAYDEPIDITIHAKNLNSISPVVRERVYRLFYGYNVKAFNNRFNNNDRIVVYIEAINKSDFSAAVKNSYYFTTISKNNSSITATINGIAPWSDISAQIYPQAPIHRYGETITVVLYAEDIQGNILGPYTFSYTIEDAPL